MLDLLQHAIPLISIEKIQKHVPRLLTLQDQWLNLQQRTPQLQQSLQQLQALVVCEYCNRQQAQLGLACNHRLCLSCFYALLGEVTQNLVIYNRFEKLQYPPLSCKLCGQTISSKDIEKGLPQFTEYQKAAEEREAKILRQCLKCSGPSEPSQHNCYCKKCFALALLARWAQCEYCQEELRPQDPMEAELAADETFTVQCVRCRLPVPFRYMMVKLCCQELVCSVCQVTENSSTCVNCRQDLDSRAKTGLRLLTQEVQLLALEEPSIFKL